MKKARHSEFDFSSCTKCNGAKQKNAGFQVQGVAIELLLAALGEQEDQWSELETQRLELEGSIAETERHCLIVDRQRDSLMASRDALMAGQMHITGDFWSFWSSRQGEDQKTHRDQHDGFTMVTKHTIVLSKKVVATFVGISDYLSFSFNQNDDLSVTCAPLWGGPEVRRDLELLLSK